MLVIVIIPTTSEFVIYSELKLSFGNASLAFAIFQLSTENMSTIYFAIQNANLLLLIKLHANASTSTWFLIYFREHLIFVYFRITQIRFLDFFVFFYFMPINNEQTFFYKRLYFSVYHQYWCRGKNFAPSGSRISMFIAIHEQMHTFWFKPFNACAYQLAFTFWTHLTSKVYSPPTKYSPTAVKCIVRAILFFIEGINDIRRCANTNDELISSRIIADFEDIDLVVDPAKRRIKRSVVLHL